MNEDYRRPMSVVMFEGAVLVEGPGAMAGAFTPEAAEASARRLMEAAAEARAWKAASD